MALKQKYQYGHYLSWPEPLVARQETAIKEAVEELAPQMERVKFDQFLVFKHLQRVREHAATQNVKLFGDLPIFVSHDSSEVWSHPHLFQLDEKLKPKFSAGVPPDYFSETGQLWGNPVYDWAALRRSGYAWWIDRLRSMMNLHDLVRLDHFRGFSALGMSLRVKRRLSTANGYLALVPNSLMRWRRRSADCLSSPKTWNDHR